MNVRINNTFQNKLLIRRSYDMYLVLKYQLPLHVVIHFKVYKQSMSLAIGHSL